MLINTKIIQSILSIILLLSCTNTSNYTNSVSIPSVKIIAGVNSGLDVLIEKQLDKLYGKRIALVTNHSGINKNGISNITQLYAKTDIQIETIFTPERDVSQQGTSNSNAAQKQNQTQIVKIFSPEHGFIGNIPRGEQVEYDFIPSEFPSVISLYGKIRKPTKNMLTNVDLIIYDIQDVGARFYTYISTLGLVLEAAGEANIPIIVLDRPNPIGGRIDGPILDDKYKSFIGKYPIPIQYGMT
ncbi:MAG: exo-beta-N-acetylmuramidase NamZ domain-containing protein, partial [Candidatus Neomarinimicrobiota bacterium]